MGLEDAEFIYLPVRKDIFTEDTEIMNMLATGKWGIRLKGYVDPSEDYVYIENYILVSLKDKLYIPVPEDSYVFNEYREYAYTNNNLDTEEQDVIADSMPTSIISVSDFTENSLTRFVYEYAMYLDEEKYAVVYDSTKGTLSIIDLEQKFSVTKLDTCNDVFTRDTNVMNLLATGKYGIICGSDVGEWDFSSNAHIDAYYLVCVKGRKLEPVRSGRLEFSGPICFTDYALHVYARDDLTESEEKKIIDSIPDCCIPVNDFTEKPLTRMLYVKVMSSMLKGTDSFIVMYDRDCETLSIMRLEW